MAIPFAALGHRTVDNYRKHHRDNVIRFRQEQLFKAAEHRNQSEVFSAINHGGILTTPNQYGETVLHLVVKKPCNDPQELVKLIKLLDVFLKQFRMKPDLKCRAGKTALHIAARNRMIEAVDYLLRIGADVHAKDIRGNFVAHHIIEGEFEKYWGMTKVAPVAPDKLWPYCHESIQYFRHMVQQWGIELDLPNKSGETPIQLAARRNLLHLLPTLINYTEITTSRDKEKKTALHLFVENKQRNNVLAIATSCYDKRYIIDILERMLNKGYSVNDVDVHGNTPLHSVIYQDELRLLEIMLNRYKKVNICNNEGNTVLHLIIDNCIDKTLGRHKEEYLEFVKLLLSRGADIHISNSKGHKPMHFAVMRVNPEILKVLKKRGADLNEPYNGGNLLHLLSQESSMGIECSNFDEVIGMLVKEGCNVNEVDKDGMTSLHLAVQSGRNAVIKGLVKYRANLEAKELSARLLTPLQMAVDTNNGYSISTLVKVGADINAKDILGKTALHLATKLENGMVTKLLRLGAWVDEEDDTGRLPLHYAIKEQNGAALSELLKFGADINDHFVYAELTELRDTGYVFFGVLEHWIKMKAAGLPIKDEYKKYTTDKSFKKIHKECLEEIKDLKAYRIGDRTSLYNLLHMDWNFRCAYTANKPLKDLMESEELEIKFPKYHVLLLACYHLAVARQPLLEPAKWAWCELTKIELPDVCVFKILSYLKNRDLRILIEGIKNKKKPNSNNSPRISDS